MATREEAQEISESVDRHAEARLARHLRETYLAKARGARSEDMRDYYQRLADTLNGAEGIIAELEDVERRLNERGFSMEEE